MVSVQFVNKYFSNEYKRILRLRLAKAFEKTWHEQLEERLNSMPAKYKKIKHNEFGRVKVVEE